MNTSDSILVVGHESMVGAALLRQVQKQGFSRLLTLDPAFPLTDQAAVRRYLTDARPDYVFLAAARVGGIIANSRYPADFIYYNLQVQTNIIHSSWKAGVKKLLFLGSSCIYPKQSPQPMKEEYLLTGKLEPTSEPYAVAKIAGIRMCQSYNQQYGTNFISVIPSDLYGPEDDFDLERSHVLAALLRKTHEAKTRNDEAVCVWGTGSPRREFLYVDEFADACLFLMDRYDHSDMINVGSGNDMAIEDLAHLIKEVTGYEGQVRFDPSKPDGAPRKLLDSGRIAALGWIPGTALRQGLEKTYQWYLNHTQEQKSSAHSGRTG